MASPKRSSTVSPSNKADSSYYAPDGVHAAPFTQAQLYDTTHPGNHHYLSQEEDLESSGLREQDRLLPIANVARIMKTALPSNAKIAKDAKETIQECVSEFIAFVTSEAGERCQQEKRKTINGEDILWAMESLGFDNYVQLLKIYLAKYKELEAGHHALGMDAADAAYNQEALDAYAALQGAQNAAVYQGYSL